MRDIHTHCLPGIDDGAKDINESIKMLKSSFEQGVREVVLTPHCVVHKNEDINDFIVRRCESEKLLRENASGDIPRLFLGAEVFLDNDLSRYEDISKLCIGGSHYMLVEMTAQLTPEKTADILYSLTLKGIVPIIAHIDRYVEWKEYVSAFRSIKVIYQVNSSNFLSIGGRCFIKNFLKLEDGFVVGSDMHNMSTRPCTMKKAYEKAKAKYGYIAERMFNNEQIDFF